MSKLQALIKKTAHSSFHRWLLNRTLAWSIPFNAPHGFKVINIETGIAKIKLPYKRSNLNHVKGIHACALATLCEFTSGLSLMTKISENSYRIILKNLNITYHYQAKMDVTAEFIIDDRLLEQEIIVPLKNSDAVFITFEIKVYDQVQNHICTGLVNWQVKKWERVKAKI